MTPEEFRKRAAARSPMLAFRNSLTLNGLGAAEEAGEVAGLIKKWLFHGRVLEPERVVEEIGDVIWYLDRALATLGYTMSECLEYNDVKLTARYPDGFKKAGE